MGDALINIDVHNNPKRNSDYFTENLVLKISSLKKN
ncbi:MAG: hypothetical protein K0S23_2745 [Fluviicola sp.]|jgi:hypothetical protein|nr:hypothetical protein [Fluviicola sp.]